METVNIINFAIGIIFFLCYFYQFVYIAIALIKKEPPHTEPTLHRYAVMIPARNEMNVIGELISSIRRQDYPSELVDIFVIADNCTDGTADVAREAGASVYERYDSERIGKGHALNYLISAIKRDHGDKNYDGYFVFDADNILEESYITEMNRTVSDGYRIVTSYRNSKNFGDNWISAGYALWFLREAKYLNYPRHLIGASGAISGTGFLFTRELLEKIGNWEHYLLTEDIEFTIARVIEGERVGFCKTAVFYDEQPTTWSQSWKQRTRWSKGFFQVFGAYGGRLIKGIFKKGGFACYDMTMNIFPAIVVTASALAINIGAAVVAAITKDAELAKTVTLSFAQMLAGTYLTLFTVGAVTTVTEWKNIYCCNAKKILFAFTFPFFMLTYIPITVATILNYKKIGWQHIEHTAGKTVSDIKSVK